MQRILLNCLALAVLSASGVTMAAETAPAHTFTSNVSLVSDCIFRGISRSGQKGGMQGGFDYAHSSGLYAGLRGASISWISDQGLAYSSTNASTANGAFYKVLSNNLGRATVVVSLSRSL